MKKLISLFLLTFLFTCSIPENKEPEKKTTSAIISSKIPVYIADGQSNAQPEWAYAIINEIRKTEPNAIMLWIWHPGHSITEWWDGEPKADVLQDCQYFLSQLNEIDYDIKAVFWFQGESDRKIDKFPYYAYRMINMVNYLKYRLNDYDFDIIISYVDSIPSTMDYIRSVQMSIVNNYADYYGYDSRGYPRYDGLHLTTPGRVLFGANQANYYMSNR